MVALEAIVLLAAIVAVSVLRMPVVNPKSHCAVQSSALVKTVGHIIIKAIVNSTANDALSRTFEQRQQCTVTAEDRMARPK